MTHTITRRNSGAPAARVRRQKASQEPELESQETGLERDETERSRPADTDDEFFFDRVAQITDAEWEARFWCYVYRLAPKINIAGDRHHIARLSARFDEQDILAKYGSGQYYARLNDKKLRKTVATHVFSVYHPDKPPVCDLSLIVDCPENEPYLKWMTRKSDAPIAADTAAVGELAKIAGKLLD